MNFEESVINCNFQLISADFPFITYYLINKQNTDPVDFYNEVQCAALRKFDPRDLRYAANHTLDLFNEVATIARPPLEPPGVRPPIPSTGYIVSIFKVFEGDDGLKFEQNWLYWTGTSFSFIRIYYIWSFYPVTILICKWIIKFLLWLYICFRCPYDVPIFAEIGGPEANHIAQVHVTRRQNVPTDLRVFAIARQSLRGSDIVARVTCPFMRLHRSL